MKTLKNQLFPVSLFKGFNNQWKDYLEVEDDDIEETWFDYNHDEWELDGVERWKINIYHQIALTLRSFSKEIFVDELMLNNPIYEIAWDGINFNSITNVTYKGEKFETFYVDMELDLVAIKNFIHTIETENQEELNQWLSRQKHKEWEYWKDKLLYSEDKGILNLIFELVKNIYNHEKIYNLFHTVFLEDFDKSEKSSYMVSFIPENLPVDQVDPNLIRQVLLYQLQFDETIDKLNFGWTQKLMEQAKEKIEMYGSGDWKEEFLNGKEYDYKAYDIVLDTIYKEGYIPYKHFKMVGVEKELKKY